MQDEINDLKVKVSGLSDCLEDCDSRQKPVCGKFYQIAKRVKLTRFMC